MGWWVSQKGATSVEFSSKGKADKAAKSLKGAKVTKGGRPEFGGRHTTSDGGGKGFWNWFAG